MHVIATAGHVDHGKSTLLRSLTGMDPDRWAEEHRRGMTIDLGYVWTTLPVHGDLVFVDVPGHERFITNMLAGIGPVPAALLVIAADEGWCKQTEEHAAALEALGVRHGLLAVTRCDLAPAGPAINAAKRRLAGTCLDAFEAVAVSGATGEGLGELREALERLVATMPAPASSATRLWVDRVFTVRGAGTVVTGTLTGGSISIGDELLVSPSGESVRVKGVESLKQRIGSVSAVARVAVNLRGLDRNRLRRGDALLARGRWSEAYTMDVRVETERLPTAPMLHLGSAAASAHVRPLGAHTARLAVRRPLPVHVGERLILRDPGTRHVTGAVVLDTDPPPLDRRGAAARRDAELAAVTGEPDPAGEVRRRGTVRRDLLVTAGVLAPDAPTPEGAVSAGAWLADADRWRDWQRELTRLVDRHARERPLAPGLIPATAARVLGLPESAVLEPLVAACAELVVDAHGIHRRGTTPTLPDQPAAALHRLRERLQREPFAAPELPELAEAGLTAAHLAVAVQQEQLLRVADGVYLLPDAPAQAHRALAGLTEPFTISEARRVLGTSRRVAVPLLELLDGYGVTVRVDGNRRKLTGERCSGQVPGQAPEDTGLR
ncbi:selenocysteine-specific translation elongation factor [Sciscionella marina]|uniref:selenocysteine-specific translation elongation factor n=1 Tax=Sciscionella marina TaxID=508770 RepID=UPI00035EED3A|nr:selenocysteine-specific translation elongation factor [Sciscionella marina]